MNLPSVLSKAYHDGLGFLTGREVCLLKKYYKIWSNRTLTGASCPKNKCWCFFSFLLCSMFSFLCIIFQISLLKISIFALKVCLIFPHFKLSVVYLIWEGYKELFKINCFTVPWNTTEAKKITALNFLLFFLSPCLAMSCYEGDFQSP